MQKTAHKIALAITVTGLISLCAQAVSAGEDEKLSVTSGFDYSSGKYGTDSRTDILSIPIIVKYEADRWTLKLTVPYVSITGVGNVLPDIGQVKGHISTRRTTESGLGDVVAVIFGQDRTEAPRRTTESGLGDVVAGATYNIYRGGADALVVDFTGKVKFGTADEDKGLGTGKNDYSSQFDLYKSFGKVTVLGTVGYKVYGDTNAVPLENVFFGSVGGTYKLANDTSPGVIYDYRPSISQNGSNLSELTAFVNHKISRAWKGQGYLVKGLADGSPDYGVGALVTHAF